jgi:flagellar biosynthetic protein FliP
MMRLYAYGVIVLLGIDGANAADGVFDSFTQKTFGTASAQAIQIFITLTVLSLAPTLLLTMTSFTRFVIAFSFLRSGLGLQSTPATLILIALSLMMSAFVMRSTVEEAWREGVAPYLEARISDEGALARIAIPFQTFMQKNVRDRDYEVFAKFDSQFRESKGDDSPVFAILVPAFMISELRRGFEIGFLILLPFLIIDMIVAIVVMSMGMMMVPPSVIALPLKVMFFVIIDGWSMLVSSLLRSYN